jgi:hypothetical protein
MARWVRSEDRTSLTTSLGGTTNKGIVLLKTHLSEETTLISRKCKNATTQRRHNMGNDGL